jgi:hypothetical protein
MVRQVPIIGDDHTGVPIRTEILARIKTVTGDIAQNGLAAPVETRTVGLGGIGDNLQ